MQLYKECLLYNQRRERAKRPHIRFLRNKLIPNSRAEFLEFKGAHNEILIGTPERAERLLKWGKRADLADLQYLVLDEADKLFEWGFVEQIDSIAKKLSKAKQCTKAMFSATIQERLEQAMHSLMKQPIKIVIGRKNSAVSSVKQELVYTGSE